MRNLNLGQSQMSIGPFLQAEGEGGASPSWSAEEYLENLKTRKLDNLKT